MQNKNTPPPKKKAPGKVVLKKVININFHKQTSLHAHDKGPDSPTNTINKCHRDTNFQWCRHEKKKETVLCFNCKYVHLGNLILLCYPNIKYSQIINTGLSG